MKKVLLILSCMVISFASAGGPTQEQMHEQLDTYFLSLFHVHCNVDVVDNMKKAGEAYLALQSNDTSDVHKHALALLSEVFKHGSKFTTRREQTASEEEQAEHVRALVQSHKAAYECLLHLQGSDRMPDADVIEVYTRFEIALPDKSNYAPAAHLLSISSLSGDSSSEGPGSGAGQDGQTEAETEPFDMKALESDPDFSDLAEEAGKPFYRNPFIVIPVVITVAAGVSIVGYFLMKKFMGGEKEDPANSQEKTKEVTSEQEQPGPC